MLLAQTGAETVSWINAISQIGATGILALLLIMTPKILASVKEMQGAVHTAFQQQQEHDAEERRYERDHCEKQFELMTRAFKELGDSVRDSNRNVAEAVRAQAEAIRTIGMLSGASHKRGGDKEQS